MKLNKPALIAGIWLFLGLIYSSQSFFYSLSVGREYVWQRSLFHSFVFCLEWALLTSLVLFLAERFRLDSKNLPKNIFIHFVLGSTIALLQQTVYVLVVDFIEGGFVFTKEPTKYLPSIVGFFEYGVLMYWSIVFIHHAIGYYRRYQQEEQNAIQLRSQLVESQLQTLKMQLQPHFLFNTLNAISVLVKKEPNLAQKMIVRLSDLLRLTLERGNENEVTLEQELEFLNTYLSIEKVRFGDRLQTKMNIDERSLQALVPTFILQPLVENSLRHGIAQRSGEGWIEIRSEMNENDLIIEVIDGSVNVRKSKKNVDGIGVGLQNTRLRLSQLYQDKFTFEFIENKNNGSTVRFTIPVKR